MDEMARIFCRVEEVSVLGVAIHWYSDYHDALSVKILVIVSFVLLDYYLFEQSSLEIQKMLIHIMYGLGN